MKKPTFLLLALLFSFCTTIHSQVGVGTISPKSIIDIPATNQATPSNTDGILIPRIDAFPITNPGADQNGMLVFLTTNVGTYEVGFHYWDHPNTQWVGIGTEEWKKGVNAGGDDLIYATRAKSTGTDMVITHDGRIGFGTSDPIERFEFRGPGDNDFQITSANTNPPNFILYNTGGTIDLPTALAANQEIGAMVIKTHDGIGVRENGGVRFYMDGAPSPGSVPSKFVVSNVPSGSTSQIQRIVVRSNGNMGVSESNPTATLHLRAGTASAGSAPLKLTSGINLTTPEAGTIEYDGSNLYFTPTTSRQVVMMGYNNTASLNFPSISSNSYSDLTINVTGAALGDTCSCAPNGAIEPGLSWNCFVSAVNTVTVRVANVQGSSINPVSRNWKVNVIK
ncbi:MAG: hypothetical protein HKN48_10830 [Flavobacteriaceae bacterium]|nr:hypothetical protein [Flavobacteriaceae bacterium]